MQKRQVEQAARAKINLALHVTGRRADGYHLLDSLVVFTDTADHLSLSVADETRLEITGPFASGLKVDDNNLVLQAYRQLSKTLDKPLPPTAFNLTKNLPVSSGIGGGSADAAAALRGLVDLWQLDMYPDTLAEIALGLGADVPVCLNSTTCRMSGVGEKLTPVTNFPPVHCVLVNPGVGVSTAAIFAELALPVGETALSDMGGLPENSWINWLAGRRNDLQGPATTIASEIADCINALDQSAFCLLARMSGSGATCFGLYGNKHDAEHAARKIADAQPDWWVVATRAG